MKKLLLLFILAPQCWASPAKVQVPTGTNVTGAGTTCSVTITASGSGNLLLLMVYSNVAITSVTDSASESYSAAFDLVINSNDGRREALYYFANSAAGVTSITANFGSSPFASCIAGEYSGVATTAPLDKTSTNPTTGTTFDSGLTATTTQASELLIGLAGTNASATPGYTESGGFTIQRDQSSGSFPSDLIFADQIVSSTGTYKHNGTSSTSGNHASGIAAFKPAGAAAKTCTLSLMGAGPC